MKSALLTVFFAIVATTILLPQNLSTDYGKITDYELKMPFYNKDPQAGAVVLYDFGLSRFIESMESTFESVFEKSTKIKILKESGIDYATFSIPYYQEGLIKEQIYDLIAITYNLENGEVKKSSLNQSNFYDEKLSENWTIRKFTMPDVKPGSVIEIKYKIRSRYLMNLHDWEFQWDIPVITSEYVARMIPFYEYTFILQGASRFDKQNSFADKANPRSIAIPGASKPLEFFDMVYSFGMQDVPAYTDNEFISSRNDYVIKIDFQLARVYQFGGTERSIISTWPELIRDLLADNNLGKFMSKSGGQLKSAIGNIKDSGKTQIELYDEIMSYVKSNYVWNGMTSKYAIKTVDKFVKDKEGNSAEINLFAAGLLQAAGIDASPLLISTRRNGKIKSDYPFLHFFNNVIVVARIDDKYILGDATEPLLPNNRIPERCINESGLLIKKGDPVWISLQPLQPSSILTIFLLTVGEIETKVALQKSLTEFDASDMRKYIASDKEYLSDYIKSLNYSGFDSVTDVQNLNDPFKPLVIKYTVLEKTESIADKIFVPPFPKESLLINPLTRNNRTQPLDFIYPVIRTFSSTIQIPEGYDVEFLPSFPSVDNPLFKITYTAERNGNTIQANMLYHFKLGIYKASDYNAIKQYFNDIIKYSNEKIILKKM